MSTMTPVPPDHPLMKAWAIYKQSYEYRNTAKWALIEKHTEGSLWAAFEEGWRAAKAEAHVPIDQERVR